MRRLKIFSDRNYIPNGMGHVMMLFPFWGEGHPQNGRFERYSEIGRSFFEMTSLEEADIAVMPVAWELVTNNDPAMDLAHEFAEKVKASGKRTIIFFWSDSDEEVPIDGTVVFRTSMYRSKRRTNEYAMPAWGDDFVAKYREGRVLVREKGETPIVGFCGYAAPLEPSFGWKLRTAASASAAILRERKMQAKGGPLTLGATIRKEALRYLSQDNRVQTNFIIRDRFLAGARLADGRVDLDTFSKAQFEYVQNMIGSDYVLCARGRGNFSYRLYETLSCGRIPIFVDTDCVLPYDFALNWARHSVWVDAGELSKISEKVVEFHDNLSPQKFKDIQRENRVFWERWLSPEGFFTNLHKHFPSGRL
jgi:hypothetical protein